MASDTDLALLDLYLLDVSRHRLLTAPEEQSLARRIEAGDREAIERAVAQRGRAIALPVHAGQELRRIDAAERRTAWLAQVHRFAGCAAGGRRRGDRAHARRGAGRDRCDGGGTTGGPARGRRRVEASARPKPRDHRAAVRAPRRPAARASSACVPAGCARSRNRHSPAFVGSRPCRHLPAPRAARHPASADNACGRSGRAESIRKEHACISHMSSSPRCSRSC